MHEVEAEAGTNYLISCCALSIYTIQYVPLEIHLSQYILPTPFVQSTIVRGREWGRTAHPLQLPSYQGVGTSLLKQPRAAMGGAFTDIWEVWGMGMESVSRLRVVRGYEGEHFE